MQQHPENPPAFPVAACNDTGGLFHVEGMTLRDWFAGQALGGLCARGMPAGHANGKDAARVCFGLADAMLSARSGEVA